MQPHKIKIGFEFEFCSRFGRNRVVEDLKDCFDLSFCGPHRQTWRLACDTSIKTTARNYGHELISPPLQYTTGLDMLRNIFDWMAETECRTNQTTGLHVNLSFTALERTRKIDPIKLIVFTPCKEWLTQYKRQKNIYCKSYDNDFKLWTKCAKAVHSRTWKDVVKVFRQQLYDSCIGDLKYRAISYHRDKLNPYYEFRMIGNKDYHKRFSEIKLNIDEMVEVLHISSDASSCVTEYEQAISKYLT